MSTIQLQVNALVLGLFLLAAYWMIVARQVAATLQGFVLQALLLALSAFVLGARPLSGHLIALGIVTIVSKPILIPWVLRRLVPEEIYTKRELAQSINVPTSLLISFALAIIAYFVSLPLLAAAGRALAPGNVSIGLAGLLLGVYQVAVRREAVPQLLGILAMENGAFLAGVAIAPDFPLIAELAIAFDVPLLAFIVGLLTRAMYMRVGTTEVAMLTSLREEGSS